MPSNKTKVASYLNDAEEKALLEFTKKAKLSNSEAVNFLIRKQLIEKLDVSRNVVFGNQNRERIEVLEEAHRVEIIGRRNIADKVEELKAEMSEIRERVEQMYIQNTKRSLEPISDEQIAAITHQPEWKVRLWRHGQMKPRGKRIKKRLEPFCVKEGHWERRDGRRN